MTVGRKPYYTPPVNSITGRKHCMKGRIYSTEKCPKCGSSYSYNERKDGLFCKKHPKQYATKNFIVKFGRDIIKRFKTFFEAQRFLTGLRYKSDEGTFDARDYKKDNPLGFETLVEKWLLIKEKEVKQKTLRGLRSDMRKAIQEWGDTNIKEIGYAEIEDFLYAQDVADKTRANIKSCLHNFWTWLRKRHVITAQQFPEFPEIKYELGWRKIVDKRTQESIIEEVKRISFDLNPKIWLGIKWLSTYISIRPGELVHMKEEDVNIKMGIFIIPDPKEKKPKLVPILDEDIELIKQFTRGLPQMHFFRHTRSTRAVIVDKPFGNDYLYTYWKKACANLGIEGVDLYGGTKHSTATALREVLSPEQIRRGTMHATNKAFERYMQSNIEDASRVYRAAAELTKGDFENEKIIKMRNWKK